MAVKERIEYKPEAFYRFGLNNMFKTEIARHYGVSPGTISHQLGKTSIKDAYEKGLAEYKKQNSPDPQPPENEDAGGDVFAPKTEKLREMILAAVRDFYCTERQIKTRAGIPIDFDISAILFDMATSLRPDGHAQPDLQELSNGTVTAYFPLGMGRRAILAYRRRHDRREARSKAPALESTDREKRRSGRGF